MDTATYIPDTLPDGSVSAECWNKPAPPYAIQPVNREHGRHITGSADDIHAALNAAWQLNRHIEDSVEIIDNRDGAPRVVAVLTLEWKDGE